MGKVQHFLQFLFPDLPCHENCWCSPTLLAAVAAGSSVWPGPLLSWRREVAQGCLQQQLREPGRQPWPRCKSPWGTLGISAYGGVSLGLLSMFQPFICHLQMYCKEMCFHWEKHCWGHDWKGLLHGDGHFLAQRWAFSKHLKHSTQ